MRTPRPSPIDTPIHHEAVRAGRVAPKSAAAAKAKAGASLPIAVNVRQTSGVSATNRPTHAPLVQPKTCAAPRVRKAAATTPMQTATLFAATIGR